jgi:hypothetical protein
VGGTAPIVEQLIEGGQSEQPALVDLRESLLLKVSPAPAFFGDQVVGQGQQFAFVSQLALS